MAPPATLLALLLVPAAVALQADLGKSNDDKKHKPALHGHEKTHHRAGLHEKMRHGPAAHDKPEGAALALHKHGLHGKAEKSGAKHGLHEKTEKTIARHSLHEKSAAESHGKHRKKKEDAVEEVVEEELVEDDSQCADRRGERDQVLLRRDVASEGRFPAAPRVVPGVW
ncbi:unnamed protein product [Prorocentrum cordatum]|uniref:Uncharacterized protein n=1 Tax=Prorocentrum cordatum TaxID=2364126 RepID=A0ABN9UB72_9DINO|nr:unnamed protein product [Polarella glacialis]